MEIFVGFWSNLLPFLVVLTVLVFVHELGHYWVARRCGVRVEVFSIGFGPEIFGWNDKADTRWKISAIPLGGYVKMFGEGETSGDDEVPRPLTSAERRVSFRYKSLAARASIVFAGPAANFLFAIIVLGCLFGFKGQAFTPATFNKINPGSAAEEAGLKPGDLIVRLDGIAIERFEDVQQIVRMNPDKSMEIVIVRNGSEVALDVTPKSNEMRDITGSIVRVGQLGIARVTPAKIGGFSEDSVAKKAGLQDGDLIIRIGGETVEDFLDVRRIVRENPAKSIDVVVDRGGAEISLPVMPSVLEVQDKDCKPKKIGYLGIRPKQIERREFRQFGPAAALWQAVKETWNVSVSSLLTVSQVIVGSRSADELGGPIKIAQVSGAVWKLGLVELVSWMVVLSISLGLINLFPIPLLDGGHLLFFACEAVRGRPLGERTQEYGFRIGLVLVLSLMVFVFTNDILSIFRCYF